LEPSDSGATAFSFPSASSTNVGTATYLTVCVSRRNIRGRRRSKGFLRGPLSDFPTKKRGLRFVGRRLLSVHVHTSYATVQVFTFTDNVRCPMNECQHSTLSRVVTQLRPLRPGGIRGTCVPSLNFGPRIPRPSEGCGYEADIEDVK
jgi:hypothetical protein